MPADAPRRQFLQALSVAVAPLIAGCTDTLGGNGPARVTQSLLIASRSLDYHRLSNDAQAPEAVPIEVIDGVWGRGSEVHLTGAVETPGCTTPVIDSVDVESDTGTNEPPRLTVTIDAGSSDPTCDRETTRWRYDLYLTDANDFDYPPPPVRIIEAPDNQQAEFGFAVRQ